ncbi:RNA 2',3'-cyclic phosphodiesterase [Dissulfurispira thermophila]|uniref:RNA 2',3'-cyclic phosphodiesterase n=2 Tax=root TaxID=1 RepID=A0A7G1H148_9BACT|nr:RNA 2',3'-cyclic phosphodiesterase [Dissulfurispira thermophila]BCB96540.1 RNA 2',3'-cyclic phosphodiesterase [Dissulfurispira thermophila]
MFIRCFIAIDMSENIKNAIADVIKKCGLTLKGVRWVLVENIHLTLKFLGDVEEDLIPEIEKELASICKRHNVFKINIRGAGAFPNFKYPNVLWIGIDQSEELKGLYEDIEKSMSALGFEREDRRFSPHLTIGRVKDRKGIESVIKELYTFKDTFFGSIEVNEVLLMRSVLKPTGAEYSKIADFKLSSNVV